MTSRTRGRWIRGTVAVNRREIPGGGASAARRQHEVEGLDRPTSLEFIGKTAFVITRKMIRIDNAGRPPFGYRKSRRPLSARESGAPHCLAGRTDGSVDLVRDRFDSAGSIAYRGSP